MPHIPNPTILEREGHVERAWDVYSRLFRDRIIYLGTPINDDVANIFVAQLLFLNSDDPDRDIQIYINSPGGEVAAGMIMYDVMQYVKPDVVTVCLNASSMAAVLLAAGTKGKRFILPHGKVMIHQGSGGFHGNTPDVRIQVREMDDAINTLIQLIADHSGQPYDRVQRDSERDYFMKAKDAVEYGIVDDVLQPQKALMATASMSLATSGGNGSKPS
ncbi:MAG: ATP-dependent Clp protease proteolytic subunit [Chloroflexi bacterium]|nr:ATP-dependent Clp protease proteolytic subunit [Chloroflexota bacterium]